MALMGSITASVSRRGRSVMAALVAVALAGGASAETTVLRHFTLFDGTGRAPVADQALVIIDGKLSWVGPDAKLKAPAGATVENLAGKFVMPGLIDNHVHLGLVNGITQDLKYQTPENIEKQLHLYAAYGVTSVQTLGTEKDIIFPIRDAERGTRPDKARVFTVGRGVVFKGSYGGVPGLEQSVATPEEARQMVDAQAAKNVDAIKLWVDDEFGALSERMPPAISSAVIDEAHKDGKKAIAHIFYYDNAAELTREGVNGGEGRVADGGDAEPRSLLHLCHPAVPQRSVLRAWRDAGGAGRVGEPRAREEALIRPQLPQICADASQRDAELRGRSQSRRALRHGYRQRPNGALPRIFRALGIGTDGEGRRDAAAGAHCRDRLKRRIPRCARHWHGSVGKMG
jgi:hypothetical protein